MAKVLCALRGATGAENTIESITKTVGEMCEKLFENNAVSMEDVVSLHFTITDDLTAMNPAAALRKSGIKFDVSKLALFCSQEPKIDNSPERMIRVLLTCYKEDSSEKKHVYINGAEKLRPDFAKK